MNEFITLIIYHGGSFDRNETQKHEYSSGEMAV